jgi:hypothetical protein
MHLPANAGLIFLTDELTNDRYLVDTRATLSIVPCNQNTSPSCPLLKGADGQQSPLGASSKLLCNCQKNALPVYSRPHKVFVGIFIIKPIRLGGQRHFVLPKLEIEIERRLQGKISRKISTSDSRLEVTSVEIAILRCVSYFFSS